MNKKLSLLFTLLALATISYSQTKVLVIGFPEKNLISEFKSKEKLAKRNSTTVDLVDDLYRNSLLDAIKNTQGKIQFVIAKKNEEELFSEINYSMLSNNRNKEYFGPVSFRNKDLSKVFDKYGVDYVVHISQYRLYMSMGLNMHTKIVHRFDYLFFNREFEILSADKFKFSGLFQGAFKPDAVSSNYTNKARKMSKRLSECITD